jgi:hypothetical protein
MSNKYVPLEPTFYTRSDTIMFYAGGDEMLKVSPDGFWVRGVKVEQGSGEAQSVYQAMKEFVTWQQLNRPY